MTVINDLGIVIAAGGSSSRFGAENKLFASLHGKPVFIYCIITFCKIVPPENIVVTVPKDLISDFEQILDMEPGCKRVKVVAGGQTRTASVKNGIKAIGRNLTYVAIHDAARPLVTNKLLADCYHEAQMSQAAIPGKRVTDTIKRVTTDLTIDETVDRDCLVSVETPQVFCLPTLLSAYKKATGDDIEATDDAGIMEHAGYSPKIVLSDKLNLKITYEEDLLLVRAYLGCNS